MNTNYRMGSLKIMKKLIFGTLFFIGVMCNTAWGFEEFPITTNPANQYGPAIYGNIVVWQDERNGDYDIYSYNLLTFTEFPISTNLSEQYSPAIYGNTIVWQDNRNGNSDIYGYNLSTDEEFQITTNVADEWDPAVYGDIVVWTDTRNSYVTDIYGYNLLASKEFQITTNAFGQQTPDIYSNTVIWMDYRNGNFDIYGATIPEPGTILLFGSGLLGLCFIKRYRFLNKELSSERR